MQAQPISGNSLSAVLKAMLHMRALARSELPFTSAVIILVRCSLFGRFMVGAFYAKAN
jgi:hypothetical protein